MYALFFHSQTHTNTHARIHPHTHAHKNKKSERKETFTTINSYSYCARFHPQGGVTSGIEGFRRIYHRRAETHTTNNASSLLSWQYFSSHVVKLGVCSAISIPLMVSVLQWSGAVLWNMWSRAQPCSALSPHRQSLLSPGKMQAKCGKSHPINVNND